MILTLFGPPGSGKGTQSVFLCERFGLAHLATGDLLRAERKAGTQLGRKAAAIMNRGELVPDELVGKIVQNEARKVLGRGDGILFDGYPRNLNQLKDLERILSDLGTKLDFGVEFEIDDGKLIRRLSSRWICDECQTPYNLITQTPLVAGVCDICGGHLSRRADDGPEAIPKRLEEYHQQTEPMLEDLRRRGKLKTVVADQPIEAVRQQLIQVIDERRNGSHGD